MIYIDKETQKRVNIYAPYKAFSILNTTLIREAAGVIEITDDEPPAEALTNPEYYIRDEDWNTTQRPYTIWTRIPEEQIQQLMLSKFVQAMEGYYDKVAQVKKYDNRLSCTLRAGYAGPFQAEGLAFATWMDNCNAYGYGEMAKVMGGLRPVPAVAELLAELPEAPWKIEE